MANIRLIKSLLINESALQNLSNDEIVEWLNNPTVTYNQFFITSRTLAVTLGTVKAVTILQTLKAISLDNDNPLSKIAEFILYLLNDISGGGIDISLEEARTYVDSFVGLGLLEAEDGIKIKALSEVKVYKAGSAVELADIVLAKASNQADLDATALLNILSDGYRIAQNTLQTYQNAVLDGQDIELPTKEKLLKLF